MGDRSNETTQDTKFLILPDLTSILFEVKTARDIGNIICGLGKGDFIGFLPDVLEMPVEQITISQRTTKEGLGFFLVRLENITTVDRIIFDSTPATGHPLSYQLKFDNIGYIILFCIMQSPYSLRYRKTTGIWRNLDYRIHIDQGKGTETQNRKYHRQISQKFDLYGAQDNGKTKQEKSKNSNSITCFDIDEKTPVWFNYLESGE